MNDNMEMDVHGLKCDNPKCDWEDMTIPYEDYEKNVNAPCPECGENILTEKDYNEILQMKNAVEMVKNMSEEDINNMLQNLTPDQMDQALDFMNDTFVKKSDNEDGTSNWEAK